MKNVDKLTSAMIDKADHSQIAFRSYSEYLLDIVRSLIHLEPFQLYHYSSGIAPGG